MKTILRMVLYNIFFKYSAIVIIICLAVACRDLSPSSSTAPISSHSSGCIYMGLEKSAVEIAVDSIFNYSFVRNDLDLDFSVIASCGRDEDAFIVQYMISGDTIDIGVIDTNRFVARCFCMYMIKVSDFPAIQDRYFVRCTYHRSIDSLSYICHFVEVHRSPEEQKIWVAHFYTGGIQCDTSNKYQPPDIKVILENAGATVFDTRIEGYLVCAACGCPAYAAMHYALIKSSDLFKANNLGFSQKDPPDY
jgi:hypothetical protein